MYTITDAYNSKDVFIIRDKSIGIYTDRPGFRIYLPISQCQLKQILGSLYAISLPDWLYTKNFKDNHISPNRSMYKVSYHKSLI